MPIAPRRPPESASNQNKCGIATTDASKDWPVAIAADTRKVTALARTGITAQCITRMVSALVPKSSHGGRRKPKSSHGGRRKPGPGKTLGRPRSPERCACGKHTAARAQRSRLKCRL